MGEPRIEVQKIRNELRSKRNLLFADFTKKTIEHALGA